MKITGNIPKTVARAAQKHADQISEIWNEGDDGLWVLLKADYWNAEASVTTLHEQTAKDLVAAFKWIRRRGYNLAGKWVGDPECPGAPSP